MSEQKTKLLVAGMINWYLGHTAREAEKKGALAGYWVSNANTSGVSGQAYKRIWPYHLAQKPFYHMPFVNLEEKMRWANLRWYDVWMASQKLPNGVNVVQAPMGSCEALFRLAEQSKEKVLKVFDAPNSHPTSHYGYWQRECDLYSPGYVAPLPLRVRSRMNREIEAADMVLCPSNFVKDSMVMNGIPEGKCFVSNFGVDTSTFKKRDKVPAKPVFVCVGSICLRKGHQYLFRAFEILKKSVPDAELICIGGVRPDFYREMKKWKGTFTHYHTVTHTRIAQILGGCTAFLLPSLEEGFARVLSEAMAVGLPIIASYESGATTVVHDGQEGIIVQPRDINAIAKAMKLCADDHAENQRMGDAAFRAGAESNTWEDYTVRLLNEYTRRLEGL